MSAGQQCCKRMIGTAQQSRFRGAQQKIVRPLLSWLELRVVSVVISRFKSKYFINILLHFPNLTSETAVGMLKFHSCRLIMFDYIHEDEQGLNLGHGSERSKTNLLYLYLSC